MIKNLLSNVCIHWSRKKDEQKMNHGFLDTKLLWKITKCKIFIFILFFYLNVT